MPMKFDLKRPCQDCPFRSDRHFGLLPDRVRQILGDERKGRQWWPASSFPCHKTIDYRDDDSTHVPQTAQQCAGVMIILTREGRPNDAMQIGERFKRCDPKGLDMTAPVYESTRAAIEGQNPK
jgi:hypothetical protein